MTDLDHIERVARRVAATPTPEAIAELVGAALGLAQAHRELVDTDPAKITAAAWSRSCDKLRNQRDFARRRAEAMRDLADAGGPVGGASIGPLTWER